MSVEIKNIDIKFDSSNIHLLAFYEEIKVLAEEKGYNCYMIDQSYDHIVLTFEPYADCIKIYAFIRTIEKLMKKHEKS